MLTAEPGLDVKPFHSRQIVTFAPARGMASLTLDAPQEDLLASPSKKTLVERLVRENGIEVLNN